MRAFQQFCEAINRPNDIAGGGYDDDYVKNPYHAILRAHGFEYKGSHESLAGVCHLYGRNITGHTEAGGIDNNSAEVCGIYWTVFFAHGAVKQGGHPNTKRAGADLERELVGVGL